MNNGNFKDIRLIEAFDYIDPKYVAEVGESLKLRSVQDKEYVKPTFGKQVKQIALLVGCLLLLSCAFPAFNYVLEVVSSMAAGWGSEAETSEIIETTNGMYDEYVLTEEDLAQINEAYFQYRIAVFIDEGFELSDEDIKQMKNDKYWQYAITVEEAMCRNEFDRFYFGKYGDCFIFGIAANSGWGFNFPIYDLGEYRIGINGNICVAYEYEWMPLSEVYERGLLSDEDVVKLYEVYCNYYKGDNEK